MDIAAHGCNEKFICTFKAVVYYVWQEFRCKNHALGSCLVFKSAAFLRCGVWGGFGGRQRFEGRDLLNCGRIFFLKSTGHYSMYSNCWSSAMLYYSTKLEVPQAWINSMTTFIKNTVRLTIIRRNQIVNAFTTNKEYSYIIMHDQKQNLQRLFTTNDTFTISKTLNAKCIDNKLTIITLIYFLKHI